MKEYYLAIDIGASSGRHILGYMDAGKLRIEEVYRFDNEAKKVEGRLLWDTEALFGEICHGLALCGKSGKAPKSMGIDTWGVDYVLLDRDLKLTGKTYAYRDSQSESLFDAVERIIPGDQLYRRTGIQKMTINTIYQLTARLAQEPETLDRAAHLLMLPDYFHFRLTGALTREYTNASTSQLLDVRAKDWDRRLIGTLGLPDGIFGALSPPGTQAGRFKKEIRETLGFDTTVILPATHDTGSAVTAFPGGSENGVWISSGTWSLMGCEQMTPVISDESLAMNFTNEGGYDYRYRFLKNIMGLWMLQSVRRELDRPMSWAALTEAAEAAEAAGVQDIVDCNDERFLAPDNMTAAIQSWCEEHGMTPPQTPGALAAVIHLSLAACYARTKKELTAVTGRTFDRIHILGGGSRNRHLNRLTAEATGLPVYAGPDEATAIGNLLAQMIADGVFSGLDEARRCVAESFEIQEYLPSRAV